MKTRPDEKTVKRWQKMTDENDHDNVRIEIAQWIIANTKIILADILDIYEQVKEDHEKNLCLLPLMGFARIGADEVMTGRVRLEDEELAKLIDDCL